MDQFFLPSEANLLPSFEKSFIAPDVKRLLALNKAIISSVPFSLVVTDLAGSIVFMNPAAEDMLGYRESELLGRSILAIHDVSELVDRARRLSAELREPITSAIDALLAKPLRGLFETAVWTYICKNKGRLPVQVRMTPIQDEHGRTVALMASSQDMTDRLQVDKYIYHLAYHDTLTGLPGRDLLRQRIDAANQHSLRDGHGFALIMLDIDHFKRINDSLGHDVGDQVLTEVGSRLRRQVLDCDTVGRFGGDEFVILLDQIDSCEEAEERANRIMAAFQAPLLLGSNKISLTASVGLSFHHGTAEGGDLLRNADIACYQSKSIGRNSLLLFTQTMAECRLTTLKMEAALRDAIDRREFFLVYQPQVCLQSGKILGVEALIRWRNPESGLIMPGTFIPVAEESGHIVEIGAWCLQTACCEIAALQNELGYPISVAVNLSPKQVHADAFQSTVEKALAVSKLAPSCLELEITEGLLMSYSEEALQILEGVQALGVTMAIDDFGTGFSNLSYITRFKVDRLKIDRSFVSRCLSDRNSMVVTKAIVALAHSLGLAVVAEGIETAEQAAELKRLQCDAAQGYFYSTPVSLEEVRLLASCNRFTGKQPDSIVSLPAKTLVAKQRSTPVRIQAKQSGVGSFNPLEPRDPLCRPAAPARIPGAARRTLTLSAEER